MSLQIKLSDYYIADFDILGYRGCVKRQYNRKIK